MTGMARVGRYGSTRVEPAPLFDVTNPSAAPPRDAHEVLFRAPVSLSVMLDGMAEAGLSDEIDAWGGAYSELLNRLLREVQRSCGWAGDPERTSILSPARLELAGVVEAVVPGFEQARWHCHVYVGAMATILATGERAPVSAEFLREGVYSSAQGFHMNQLRALAEQELEVSWGLPRDTASIYEIVDPPWHEYIGDNDRGVCPGPWPVTGARVLADERALRLAAEQEAGMIAEREAGLGPDQEKLRAAGAAYWASMVKG
ncbi:hypothetical protein SAMN05216207_10916 [Pseudonocardia ammonioxydans]|uniref:TrwC relaxase n=1 Tax=Pseudonocardia ammonioxydans TaxID=260086 RepID=A0A1I5IA24_PSUAM|nr:hypothetical protein [Pseudonocardia ammonioxydans]SFO56831.1 hypothetical protein SAMN05216207_10916 [Pseudonocardia ammonioxydans]